VNLLCWDTTIGADVVVVVGVVNDVEEDDDVDRDDDNDDDVDDERGTTGGMTGTGASAVDSPRGDGPSAEGVSGG